MNRAHRLLKHHRIIGLVAAVPLAFGALATGAGQASAVTTHHVAATKRAAVPSNYMPPLPKGVTYTPAGSNRAAALRPSHSAPGMTNHAPAAAFPADRGPTAARNAKALSHHELPKVSTTEASLKSMSTPASSIYVDGVSCWSSTGCMAVGDYDDYDTEASYSAEWNGKSWTTKKTAEKTEDGYLYWQYLAGVHCFSATNCVAVGDGEGLSDGDAYVQTWNGSKWSLSTPDVGLDAGFYAISCSSTSFCMAVGGNSSQPVAMTRVGSTWSSSAVPEVNDYGNLSAVSCVSSTFCEAVGYGDNGEEPYIALYAGSTPTWSTVSTTSPNDDYSELNGISCTSLSRCIAVGEQFYDSFQEPLVATVDTSGSTVSSVSYAVGRNPFSSWSDLYAISCASTSACTAVGNGSNNDVSDSSFAEAWNGHSWTQTRSASPGGSSAEDALYGVSCTAASSCAAVGSEEAPGSYYTELLLPETLSKGSFTASAAPAERTPDGWIAGISCAGTKFCIAAGGFNGGDWDQPLIELWNGSRWTLEAAPSSGFGSYFEGVSCSSDTSCELAGGSEGSTDAPEVVIFDGSTFNLKSVAGTASDEDGWLYSVSCSSSTFCMAAGYSDHSDGPFSVTWNGKTTSVSAMPFTDYDYGEPYTIACAAKTFCRAAVQYGSPDGEQFEMDSWNGSSWSISLKQVTVSNAEDNYIDGMTCVSTKRCVAVGETYSTSTDAWVPLSLIWNGKSWASHVMSNPADTYDGELEGVSCPSSTRCVAVGERENEYGSYVAVEATLSGSSWSAVDEVTKSYAELYGISCVSTTECFAGGELWPQISNYQAWGVQDKSGKWSTAFTN